jgi:hypothetical protein
VHRDACITVSSLFDVKAPGCVIEAPHSPKNIAKPYFPLASPAHFPIYRLAQIARACGRVSVGGTPDKRPAERLKTKPAAGGEPANSV